MRAQLCQIVHKILYYTSRVVEIVLVLPKHNGLPLGLIQACSSPPPPPPKELHLQTNHDDEKYLRSSILM